ncbi:NEDD4-binding protein 1 [Polypterus senegalus]
MNEYFNQDGNNFLQNPDRFTPDPRLQCITDDFTAPAASQQTIFTYKPQVESVFSVTLNIHQRQTVDEDPEEEQLVGVMPSSPYRKSREPIWLQLQGERADVDSAKGFIKGLCTTELQEEVNYPRDLHCVFIGAQSLFMNCLIRATSAFIMVGSHGCLLVSGLIEPVVMARSWITSLKEKYSQNQRLPDDREILIKKKFKTLIEKYDDKHSIDLLLLPSSVKEDLLELVERFYKIHEEAANQMSNLKESSIQILCNRASAPKYRQSNVEDLPCENRGTVEFIQHANLDHFAHLTLDKNVNNSEMSNDRIPTESIDPMCFPCAGAAKDFSHSSENVQHKSNPITNVYPCLTGLKDTVAYSTPQKSPEKIHDNKDSHPSSGSDNETKILLTFFTTMGYQEEVVGKVLSRASKLEVSQILDMIQQEQDKNSDLGISSENVENLALERENSSESSLNVPNSCTSVSEDFILSVIKTAAKSCGYSEQELLEVYGKGKSTNELLVLLHADKGKESPSSKTTEHMLLTNPSPGTCYQVPVQKPLVFNTCDSLTSGMIHSKGVIPERTREWTDYNSKMFYENTNQVTRGKVTYSELPLTKPYGNAEEVPDDQQIFYDLNSGNRITNSLTRKHSLNEATQEQQVLQYNLVPGDNFGTWTQNDSFAYKSRLDLQKANCLALAPTIKGPPQNVYHSSPTKSASEKNSPRLFPHIEQEFPSIHGKSPSNNSVKRKDRKREDTKETMSQRETAVVTGQQRYLEFIQTPFELQLTNSPGIPDLRHIIIDGSNVAMTHGLGQYFSCRGIALAVQYFWDRGHRDVTVFVPQHRQKKDAKVKEQKFLTELHKLGLLSYTPSREIEGKRISSYDDRFMLQLAQEKNGVIVTNDNFRDFMDESPEWISIIKDRLLPYTFAGDHFMVPDDPLGREGPHLADFLSKKTRKAIISSHSFAGRPSPHQPSQRRSHTEVYQPQSRHPPSGLGPQGFGQHHKKQQVFKREKGEEHRTPQQTGALKSQLLEIFQDQEDMLDIVLNCNPTLNDINKLSEMILNFQASTSSRNG